MERDIKAADFRQWLQLLKRQIFIYAFAATISRHADRNAFSRRAAIKRLIGAGVATLSLIERLDCIGMVAALVGCLTL